MTEEFVENFTQDDEVTPIDVVMDITGLTREEIISSRSFTVLVIKDCPECDGFGFLEGISGKLIKKPCANCNGVGKISE